MLDELGDRVDAVVVATPDHSHAVVSAAAIRAGKHVFCEKPLTRTVHESRVLRELARKHRVATSMGNQGTYSGAFRRALELIQGGQLGQIKEVHVWNSGGGADRQEPPQETQPVPPNLDWDLWLGPAAMRPYNRQWMQRHLWRKFGTSQLGNWASHSANLGFMALKVHELWLGEPGEAKPIITTNPKTAETASHGRTTTGLATALSALTTDPKTTENVSHGRKATGSATILASALKITAKASRINRLSFPQWETLAWEIPARAGLPPITIRWYNGAAPGIDELLEPVLKTAPPKDRNNWRFAGTLIVGTKGTIHTTGHNMSFQFLPAEPFEGMQRERPETVENSRGPEQDWFAACRGAETPWANFDYASALNEFLMLGNVATQFEETLEFDPVAMKIANNAEADALLRNQYREGWSL